MSEYAFPFDEDGHLNTGMTLRDYFAAKAMQGELASQGADEGYYSERSFKLLAENSYKIADAMMEARGK